MIKDIYKIYSEEIEKIISDTNTNSIFLVGSSKDIDLKNKNSNVNDIDLFVFTNQDENQIRIIKDIENIEFDINYFSESGLKKLVDGKEYFFLKEMKDAIVLYDKQNMANRIISLCKVKFLEGPNKISEQEKQFIKSDIYSKIQRLKEKQNYEFIEYDFISKGYLKEIIVAYFKINNKWMPKDKKLLISLKNEDEKLYSLIKEYYKELDYEKLINIYEYTFKNINSKKTIKLIY